jgi:O-antigen/teichoic acid export membrane protein
MGHGVPARAPTVERRPAAVTGVDSAAVGGPDRQPGGDDEFWRRRSWWLRAGQTSVATYGATALAFAATVVAARGLGAAGFGEVVLAVSTATLVAMLLDLTLEDAVVYHGFRALQAGHLGALRALIRRSLTLDFAIGVAVAAVIVSLAEPLADLVSGGSLEAGTLRLAALAGLVGTMDGTSGGILLVARRPDLRARIMVVANATRLGGVLVAVQLGGPDAVVVAYVIGSAVAAVLQAFLAWWIGWRHWSAAGTSNGEPVSSRALLSFGFHSSLSTTLFSGRDMLIPMLLGSLAGPAAVGLFRVALLPVAAVGVAGAPIRMLLLPEQTRLAASKRYRALWRSIRVHTLAGLGVGLPAAAVGWFALETIIPLLYSDEFAGAVDASRILLVAAVVHLAGGWWKTLPTAVGKPELRTLAAASSFVLTVALLAVLAGRGSEGAALAFSLATVITWVAWLAVARALLRRADAGASAAEDPHGPAIARS